jgi:hypothetical protein
VHATTLTEAKKTVTEHPRAAQIQRVGVVSLRIIVLHLSLPASDRTRLIDIDSHNKRLLSPLGDAVMN